MNEARQNGISALSCVLPILPGKQEAWRRFCQELAGSRHGEYEWSRQRLGITKECIWFAQMPQGEMAIVYLEMEHPERVIVQLAISALPFDRWFRSQLLELHGVDVSQMLSTPCSEVLFLWQES
jgi:hypothetical protein